MKKIYTFEVKQKAQWPRTRCPKCNSGIIEFWHQVDPDAYEANEDGPYFHAAWTIKCPNCGLQTFAFHSKHNAWKAWKGLCKRLCKQPKNPDFSYLFSDDEE